MVRRLRQMQMLAVFAACLIGLGGGLWLRHLVVPLVSDSQTASRFLDQPIILAQAGILIAALCYTVLAMWRGIGILDRGDLTSDHKDSFQLLSTVADGLTRPLTFAVWVLPISGFVGTVVGVSAAIAPLGGLLNAAGSVDPSAIEKVLKGLNTAFDTTLVGLVAVVPAMILSMIAEGAVDRRVATLWQSMA